MVASKNSGLSILGSVLGRKPPIDRTVNYCGYRYASNGVILLRVPDDREDEVAPNYLRMAQQSEKWIKQIKSVKKWTRVPGSTNGEFGTLLYSFREFSVELCDVHVSLDVCHKLVSLFGVFEAARGNDIQYTDKAKDRCLLIRSGDVEGLIAPLSMKKS